MSDTDEPFPPVFALYIVRAQFTQSDAFALNMHQADNVLWGPPINSVTFAGYNGSFSDPLFGYNETNFVPTINFTSSNINIIWNTGGDAPRTQSALVLLMATRMLAVAVVVRRRRSA